MFSKNKKKSFRSATTLPWLANKSWNILNNKWRYMLFFGERERESVRPLLCASLLNQNFEREREREKAIFKYEKFVWFVIIEISVSILTKHASRWFLFKNNFFMIIIIKKVWVHFLFLSIFSHYAYDCTYIPRVEKFKKKKENFN